MKQTATPAGAGLGTGPATAARVARWRRQARAGSRFQWPHPCRPRAGRRVSPVFFGKPPDRRSATGGWCPVELPRRSPRVPRCGRARRPQRPGDRERVSALLGTAVPLERQDARRLRLLGVRAAGAARAGPAVCHATRASSAGRPGSSGRASHWPRDLASSGGRANRPAMSVSPSVRVTSHTAAGRTRGPGASGSPFRSFGTPGTARARRVQRQALLEQHLLHERRAIVAGGRLPPQRYGVPRSADTRSAIAGRCGRRARPQRGTRGDRRAARPGTSHPSADRRSGGCRRRRATPGAPPAAGTDEGHWNRDPGPGCVATAPRGRRSPGPVPRPTQPA